MSVVELRNDTPGAQHNAIREMILSLRTMSAEVVTANNIKTLIRAHPTFSASKLDVFIVKLTTTNANAGPLSVWDCTDGSTRFNMQRVEGVGDVLVVIHK